MHCLQVYDAAACLAKYLDSDQFEAAHCCCGGGGGGGQGSGRRPLIGRRVVELGAGTGVVGVMAGYLGASVVLTDLHSLVPLLDHNINRNSSLMTAGSVSARPLCWGSEPDTDLLHPDFLILANCVYYESGLETLLETVLTLTSAGRSETVILACYEERTKEIRELVSRWHAMLDEYFTILDVEPNVLDAKYMQNYNIRIVRMLRRSRQQETDSFVGVL